MARLTLLILTGTMVMMLSSSPRALSQEGIVAVMDVLRGIAKHLLLQR